MKQIRCVVTITIKGDEVSADVGVCDRNKPTQEWLTRLWAQLVGQNAELVHKRILALRGEVEEIERAANEAFAQLLDEELPKLQSDEFQNPDDIPFQ